MLKSNRLAALLLRLYTPRNNTSHISTRQSSQLVTDDNELVKNHPDITPDISETYTDEPEVDFPSDVEEYKKWSMHQARLANKPKVDPSETSVVLFPGQGSQFVGMGQKLVTFPKVVEMYEHASSILGYNLLKLCLTGPKSELDKTVYCQPAVFVASLAALEKLSEEYPKAIENCVSTAGFSIGEYAALVFAGCISFEDGLNIVKARAELMQEASEEVNSGMMTVFTNHASKLNFACFAAREYCHVKLGIENPVCKIANYLYADAKVVAGHMEALEFIRKHTGDFHLRGLKMLPVSGAFHTEIMRNAANSLKLVLEDVKFNEPNIPVYSNVTSHRYRNKKLIAKMLSEQVYKPVKWEQTLHFLYSRPQGENFPATYEVGPGKQMGLLLQKLNSKAYQTYTAINA